MRSLLACAAILCACGGKPAIVRQPGQAPPSSVMVGDCADPGKDGVVGANPHLERHDRDMDGDQVDEQVTVDRTLCTAEGNCYWNIFAGRAEGGCRRYLGTLEGGLLMRLRDRGEDGFHDLQAQWRFGGPRVLVQQYRFRTGGYRVVDALVCRLQDDDRLVCAEDRPPPQ